MTVSIILWLKESLQFTILVTMSCMALGKCLNASDYKQKEDAIALAMEELESWK